MNLDKPIYLKSSYIYPYWYAGHYIIVDARGSRGITKEGKIEVFSMLDEKYWYNCIEIGHAEIISELEANLIYPIEGLVDNSWAIDE